VSSLHTRSDLVN